MNPASFFNLLKKDSSLLTVEQMASRLKVSISEVNTFLIKYAPFLKVETNGSERFIRILRVLDPIYKDDGKQYWDYNELQQAAPPLPESWITPLASHVPYRSQGYLGACVGNGVAYAADITHMLLCPGDIPTDKDVAEFQENVTYSNGAPYDVYYPQSASAACSYYWSREVGHITDPQGSDIRAALMAWKTRGICLDRQWIYLKDGVHELKTPTPDKHPVTGESAASLASQHTIDGYARVNKVSDLKSAIYTHHAGFIAITVFDNIDTGRGTGILPMPGNAGKIGGHLLCAVGWNSDGIIALSTWRDAHWPKQILVPYDYITAYCLGMYTVLDSQEAKYAREIVYTTLSVTCSEPADIYINDSQVATAVSSFSTQVRQNIRTTIKCIAGKKAFTGIIVPDSGAVSINAVLAEQIPPPKSEIDKIKEEVNAELSQKIDSVSTDDLKQNIIDEVNQDLKKE